MTSEVAADSELEPMDLTGLPEAQLPEWLETMMLIREFEEALDPLSLAGKIPGGVHTAVGQEAVAVGVVRALKPQDVVASSHRPHHHAVAKGLAVDRMMAELFGREGPYGGGRCGTMHMADFSVGYYGGNGIVGAALGLAMGAALAAQLERRDQVAVGFFGDGGANTGRTWEAINLAAVWRLPLVAVCENNLYAVETLISDVFAGDSIAQRAEGFGLPTVVVDGQDIGDVFRAVSAARDLAATGGGPTFIEARTYRYRGHSTGQVITYRTDDEVASWRNTRDPIARLARALEEAGIIASAACDEIVERVQAQVAAAIAFADAAPWPDVASAAANVTELNVSLQENP